MDASPESAGRCRRIPVILLLYIRQQIIWLSFHHFFGKALAIDGFPKSKNKIREPVSKDHFPEESQGEPALKTSGKLW